MFTQCGQISATGALCSVMETACGTDRNTWRSSAPTPFSTCSRYGTCSREREPFPLTTLSSVRDSLCPLRQNTHSKNDETSSLSIARLWCRACCGSRLHPLIGSRPTTKRSDFAPREKRAKAPSNPATDGDELHSRLRSPSHF